MAVITGLFFIYLFIPIILLFIGSFGETWTNTLLPAGISTAWYLELWEDGSFRRAFTVSLEVVAATCVFCTLFAVPLAYALYKSASRRVMGPHVTIPIATGIGVARNALVARAALCLVSVGGGYGTISEIAFGLQFEKNVFVLAGGAEITGVYSCQEVIQAADGVARTVLGLPQVL